MNSCVTFSEHESGDSGERSITHGWFRFVREDGTLFFNNDKAPYSTSLNCGLGGVRIFPTRSMLKIDATAVPFHDQIPIEFTVTDRFGNSSVAELRESGEIELRSVNVIREIRVEGAIESILRRICADIVFDEMWEQIEGEVRNEFPDAEEQSQTDLYRMLLAKYSAEARRLYEGQDDPNEIVISINNKFIDLGVPPIVIQWPPPWDCVFKNILIAVAVTVALTLLAEQLGVATIAELAMGDALVVLAKYGITAAEAGVYFKIIGAGIIVGQALSRCS